MDNFERRDVVVYARNAVWDFAKQLDLEYFIVADDDYIDFFINIDSKGNYKHSKIKEMDIIIDIFLEYMEKAKHIDCICFAQTGDFIGGGNNPFVIYGDFKIKRKMMNFYFFRVDQKLNFMGTLNEDYISSLFHGIQGKIIFTTYLTAINQLQTQKNLGGLTDIYLEMGTYVKSFYSILAFPSCVKISAMGWRDYRFHHKTMKWHFAVPMIISEKYA